jgi:hypothetical protein
LGKTSDVEILDARDAGGVLYEAPINLQKKTTRRRDEEMEPGRFETGDEDRNATKRREKGK